MEPVNQFSWDRYPIPAHLPDVHIRDSSLPLVSIVTPSFNQGKFIRETIESVLTQDYPNIEYWVIDGGSSDETLGILRDYESDPRFHWISEPDSGQSDAINKGWSRCRGDILAWLCSDDLYFAGAIRAQVDYLLAHPDVDAVYSDALYIDVKGNPVRKYWARKFSQYELLRICFIPQPTVFLRRTLIERIGTVNPSLHYALDYEYWLRASLNGVFAYSSADIAKYRLHDDSKTVAASIQFNPEIERIITGFFEYDNVPPPIRQKSNSLLADLQLEMAINAARVNQMALALRHWQASMNYRLVRPRLFWLLLTIIEAKTHVPVANILTDRWLRFRSKW
ncbi:MAG: glycosyltransferase family 2 protein [Chloroflexota bacterium]